MLDKDAKITQVTETPSIQPNGSVKLMVVYTFTIGTLGPFTYRTAQGADSAANVAAYINEQATKLRQLGALSNV